MFKFVSLLCVEYRTVKQSMAGELATVLCMLILAGTSGASDSGWLLEPAGLPRVVRETAAGARRTAHGGRGREDTATVDHHQFFRSTSGYTLRVSGLEMRLGCRSRDGFAFC